VSTFQRLDFYGWAGGPRRGVQGQRAALLTHSAPLFFVPPDFQYQYQPHHHHCQVGHSSALSLLSPIHGHGLGFAQPRRVFMRWVTIAIPLLGVTSSTVFLRLRSPGLLEGEGSNFPPSTFVAQSGDPTEKQRAHSVTHALLIPARYLYHYANLVTR